MLRCQILDYAVGATLTQIIVVIRGADSVCSTFDGDDVALGVGNIRGQLVKRFFRFLGQIVLVKGEVYRGLSHRTIIIEVHHGLGQRIHTLGSGVRAGLGVVGGLAGGQGFLVDFGSLRLHGLNAGLCPGIDVLDVLAVFRGQIVKLVGLVDERRGFIPHIFFAGATHRSDHAGH